jgi:UMF1 family MFS transporter
MPSNTKDYASYFNFFDVTEKMAVVVSTLSCRLIEEFTDSMRNSTLALAAFFIIGIIILVLSKVEISTKDKL